VRYQYLIDDSFKIEREHGPSPSAIVVIWQKNWFTINEHRPNMGSSAPLEKGGGSWTNREKLLSMLRALDLATDAELGKKRKTLLALVETARTNPNDATYNLQYTPDTFPVVTLNCAEPRFSSIPASPGRVRNSVAVLLYGGRAIEEVPIVLSGASPPHRRWKQCGAHGTAQESQPICPLLSSR
jgi:hypothetical protein